MDFDAIEQLWRSQAGEGTSVTEAHMLEVAMKTLDRRRKASAAGAGLIGLTLLVFTLLAVLATLSGRVAAPAAAWGSFGLLVLAWLALLAWPLLRGRRDRLDAMASMPDVLKGLMEQNRTARARARVMAGVLPGAIVLLTVCLWQLHTAGKMELRQAVEAAVLLGGALLLSAILHALRYMLWLKPEWERLQRLIDQYEDEG